MEAARNPGRPIEDESNHLLLHTAQTIWDNAPQMLVLSALLLIVAFPGFYLATATSWAIAWAPLMLCTGPVWAGLVAATARMLDGDAVGNRNVLGLVRRHGPTGVRISLVPAIVGTILLGSFQILERQPDATWILVPLLLDLGIAIVVVLAAVPIFTIASSRESGGVDLWLASAGIAFAHPFSVLGTATMFGIVGWATSTVGPAALMALAPLAVLSTAVARDALMQVPARPAPKHDTTRS